VTPLPNEPPAESPVVLTWILWYIVVGMGAWGPESYWTTGQKVKLPDRHTGGGCIRPGALRVALPGDQGAPTRRGSSTWGPIRR
jgi:hypothetical protein